MQKTASPRALKISSKRQITIPAQIYHAMGFHDYALCTWTDKGLIIEPIETDDEDGTVTILRRLIAEGYSGDELIERYQEERTHNVGLRTDRNSRTASGRRPHPPL